MRSYILAIQNSLIECTAHHLFKKVGRDGTADDHRAVRNSLSDYFKKKSVSIREINSGMLFANQKWLKLTGQRAGSTSWERSNHNRKGNAGWGIYLHMRDLRTLFNEARMIYNNEDIGVAKIKHYPFKVNKIGAPPKTKISLLNSLLK